MNDYYLDSQTCYELIGPPEAEKDLEAFLLADYLVGKLPVDIKSIYCHKAVKGPLIIAFNNLYSRGLASELKSYSGVFNLRKSVANSRRMSLHAWGLAIDVNAETNGFGKTPTISKEFVKCFTDAGFDWGGLFSKPDGMHFQLKKSVLRQFYVKKEVL